MTSYMALPLPLLHADAPARALEGDGSPCMCTAAISCVKHVSPGSIFFQEVRIFQGFSGSDFYRPVQLLPRRYQTVFKIPPERVFVYSSGGVDLQVFRKSTTMPLRAFFVSIHNDARKG